MWIKARPSRLIALLLAWWLACWWGTGIWRDKVATQVHDDARQRIEQFIATSIEGYERIIATRRGMLRVLARDPTYRDALSRHAPLSAAGDEDERRRRWNADPRLAAVSRQLTTMARDLGMRTIWLMDANGNCIASSNAGEPTDHVGTHYADRDYFQEARAGRSAHQVNIGRRQLGASISFSAPVTDRNGRVIGALAGGNDLSTFTNWLDQADAFFTDRHGVVILSKDPAMILRALPNAPVHGYDAAIRKKLYKTSDIPTLDLPSQGDDRFAGLLRFTDGTVPAILGSRSVTDGEPVLHVLRPLPQLADLEHRRAVNAGTLGLVGILLFLLVAGTLRRRREQRAMALALAEREQKATQARDFLDQMVNAIADPVFVKDRAHRWVLMNNAFCELVGQPREKLIGKSDFDFFPETQARLFLDKDELVFNAGIENVNEEKITGSQGDTRIIITKKSPVTTAEGEQFLVGIISDISARKQTERLLRAREREFRTLAENLPDNIARWDPEGRYLYINPTHERTLGVPAAAVIGKTIREVFPETHLQVRAAIAQVVATGQAALFVRQPVPVPDGGMDIHDVNLMPELDDEGHVVSVLGIGRDMTAIYRMQEAIAAREQEFRTLAENSPDPIIRYDLDGRRLYVNPAYENFSGIPAREALGATVPELSTLADIDGYQENFQAATLGQRRQVEVVAITPGGPRTWLLHLIPERGPDGTVRNVLAIGHDITEIKDAQAQMARYLANAPGFVYMIRRDATGHASLPLISPGFEAQFGLSREAVRDDIAPLRARYHPDDRAHLEAAFAASAAQLTPVCVEFRAYHPERGEFWIESRATPARQADGEIHWYGIGLDITERKRAENALYESQKLLNEAQRIAHIGSWELDLAGNVLTWSDEIFRIFEVNQQQFSASYEAFLNAIHPDDREAVNRAYAESLAKRAPYAIEHRLLMADGRIKYVQEHCETHYAEDGKPLRSLGTVQDITERKRAEVALQENFDRITELNIHLEKRALELKASREQLELTEAWYRSVLQSAPDGMLVIDRHGVIVQVNAQLEIMFGYEMRELIGNRVEMLLPASIRDAHVGQRIDFVASGRTDRPMTAARNLRGCRKDGSEFPVDVSLSQLPDIVGREGDICAAIRDITERKRMENALHARELELRQSRDLLRTLMVHQTKDREEERKRIAWDVHEELGQNLMALRLNLLMLHGRLDQAGKPLQMQFQTTTEMLDRSIQVTRTVTTALRPKVLDLGIVSALEWLADEFFGQTAIACDLQLDGIEVSMSEAGVMTIFRIAEAALDNIARHAQATRARVTLERRGDDYFLGVQDDGKGFDPAIPKEEAFGLLGARERAHALGGEIRIISAPGKGTALEARIPADA